MSLGAGSLVAMVTGNKKHDVVKSTQERVMPFQPLGNDILLFGHLDWLVVFTSLLFTLSETINPKITLHIDSAGSKRLSYKKMKA